MKTTVIEDAKIVEVDGIRYEFYHLSIRTRNRILLRVFQLLGMSMVDNLTTDLGETPKEAGKKILEMLSQHLNIDAVDEIITELLSSTICPGKGKCKTDFDAVFGDDIIHMWKVIIEAAKYYYADFFAKGSEIFTQLQALADEKKEKDAAN